MQMFLHNSEDILYIYGGFSKEKVTSSSKKEGKVHEDMWMMNLKPMLSSATNNRGEFERSDKTYLY